MKTLKQHQSRLNRAEAHLKQLQDNPIFSEDDKKILIPKYKEEIRRLNQKIKTYVH